MRQFNIGVLFYGDYPALAERCLKPLTESINRGRTYVADVRIGLNACSPATLAVLKTFKDSCQVPVITYRPEQNKNVGKYPLMRRMLYDPVMPQPADYWMWFDDDSYVTRTDAGWWERVRGHVLGAHLIGHMWKIKLKPGQASGIMRQPWYNEKKLAEQATVQFVTGGWWAARTHILTDWDYPFRELHHNNGDVLLGELCRQQGYAMTNFVENVAINANEKGKNGEAVRRGITTRWPWEHGRPSDYSHQAFNLDIEV